MKIIAIEEHWNSVNIRDALDRLQNEARDESVRSSVVRLVPTVHGPGDYGLIPVLIAAAHRTAVLAYIGDGVTGVAVGDLVFGTADWRGAPIAGASDRAIMDHWFPVPAGLDLTQAAALPMALETAYRSLAQLGLSAEHTILIHGAGSTIGFAAVQIARIRGAQVLTTAGQTYAQRLRDLGATVTAYGPGIAERVGTIAHGPVDLVLDTAPVGGALPDLVQIAGGDPKRVLTISDFTAAKELGVRDSFEEGQT